MIALSSADRGGETGAEGTDEKCKKRPEQRVSDCFARYFRSLLRIGERIGYSLIGVPGIQPGSSGNELIEISVVRRGHGTGDERLCEDDFGFIASEAMWGASAFPLPSTFTINQFPNYAPFMGISKGTVI